MDILMPEDHFLNIINRYEFLTTIPYLLNEVGHFSKASQQGLMLI